MHATSIASAVTIVELTRTAARCLLQQSRAGRGFRLVAAFYFVITFTLVGLVKLLERRFLKHLRPKAAVAAAPAPDRATRIA